MTFRNTPRLMLCAAVASMIAVSSTPVVAATATGSLVISATVLSTCALTGGTIPFGNYTSAQVDQTGTLSVLCTSGVPYSIALDAGAGTGATITARKMTGSGGGTLNYSLFRETGRTSNWGNTGTTDTVSSSGSGLLQTITVYGRIPAGQTPIVGVYTDTVTVTLTY
ncbi:MAG TPA: spore coat U domain-containing protein [Herbaspirillum sp.]